MADRRKYEQPELTRFGTIGSITRGAGGSFADEAFKDDPGLDDPTVFSDPLDHP